MFFFSFFVSFFEQNILQDTLCDTRCQNPRNATVICTCEISNIALVVLSARAVARQVHLPGIIVGSTKIEGFRLDSHVGRRRRTDRAQPQPDVPPSRKCILCQPGVNGFLKSLKW